MTPDSFLLTANGWVPNHPRLPALLYRQAGEVDSADPAGDFGTRFDRHGWPPRWRDGVYDYHHYHSTAHEVLGVARGTARLMLGGPDGHEVQVQGGDALLLPAGTGHCCLEASDDFLVVGAYPEGQSWDICREAPTDEMRQRIARLPFPDCDPVEGAHGPLTRLWRDAETPQGD